MTSTSLPNPARNVWVYTAGPACQPCNATKRQLNKQGTPFSEVDVTSDPEAAERVRAWCRDEGLELVTPVVVVVGEPGQEVQSWSGFRPDRLRALAPNPR